MKSAGFAACITAWSRVSTARPMRAALTGILSIALVACAGTPSTQRRSGSPSPNASPSGSIAPATPRTEMVRLALSMLGQPYRYGGATPGGFDCSGLVQYAATGAGIHVPRTAREQMRDGMPISRGELNAGDLVFMHLARKELHVGIVIDDRNFIHAPSAGGQVRIDQLAAPPYAKGFLAARRIVDGP
jgi:cell wall-associated NlpC family hydrolase